MRLRAAVISLSESSAPRPRSSSTMCRYAFCTVEIVSSSWKVASFLALAVLVLGLIWIARGQAAPGRAEQPAASAS